MRYFRKNRLADFLSLYPELSRMTVLDVGGRPMIWRIIFKEFGVRPRRIVMLNTENESHLAEDGFEFMVGDGRKMPFDSDSFDLVFSNSVIEHVGGDEDIAAFAREVMRVGKDFYVQTPNRWFPVEPHIMALFIHWLPKPMYHKCAFLSLRWWSLRRDRKKFYEILNGIYLLERKQVAALFPMKHIAVERFAGLNKSFIVASRW
jgi:SAM-dependent methyltransferase